jgi:hypothetical protein
MKLLDIWNVDFNVIDQWPDFLCPLDTGEKVGVYADEIIRHLQCGF